MENLKLIDASEEGTVTFELYVDERYANVNGVMRKSPGTLVSIFVLPCRNRSPSIAPILKKLKI